MYLYREYFKAKVYTIWAHGPLALCLFKVLRSRSSVERLGRTPFLSSGLAPCSLNPKPMPPRLWPSSNQDNHILSFTELWAQG